MAGAILVLGVLRYRLLDLRPVARTLVIETMRDAVLVVDAHGHVVDINPAAQQLFYRTTTAAIGRPVVALLSERVGPMDLLDPGVYDLGFRADDHERDMELAVTPLADPVRRPGACSSSGTSPRDVNSNVISGGSPTPTR